MARRSLLPARLLEAPWAPAGGGSGGHHAMPGTFPASLCLPSRSRPSPLPVCCTGAACPGQTEPQCPVSPPSPHPGECPSQTHTTQAGQGRVTHQAPQRARLVWPLPSLTRSSRRSLAGGVLPMHTNTPVSFLDPSLPRVPSPREGPPGRSAAQCFYEHVPCDTKGHALQDSIHKKCPEQANTQRQRAD